MSKHRINIIIFGIAAVIIAFLIPTNGIFRYEYKQGETWTDNTLQAPFDFPVLKTDEEFKADVKRFENEYIPVFYLDTLTGGNVVNEIQRYLNISDAEIKAVSLEELAEDKRGAVTLYKRVVHIYEKGVVGDISERYSSPTIRLIDRDKIDLVARRNLYSKESAIEAIKKDLKIIGIDHPEYLIDKIQRFISTNISYSSELNDYIYKDEIDNIARAKGYVRKGQTIIERGDIVSKDKYDVLNSFKKEYIALGGKEFSLMNYFGNLLFVSIVLILSFFSLFSFDRPFLDYIRNAVFLMLMYIALVISAVAVSKIDFYSVSIYVLPMAIFPFFINNFFGSRIAVYQYIFVLLIVSVISSSPFEFFMISYLSGLAGMYILKLAYRRNTVFWAMVINLLIYVTLYTIFYIIQSDDLTDMNMANYIWFPINSILLMAVYQTIYLIEKIFKFVSNLTLIELCDTNQPLLQLMLNECPGTYHHSVQVASLAEDAAKAIGANQLLAKTGALYHDIGKSLNALMFVENSTGVSLHDELTELESVEFIKNHVTDGLKVAKKYNLPKVIVDFVETHHGDSLIYFFYRNYMDKNPDTDIDESTFRYAGPRPSTKETTIVMMADAVEAASRSLRKHTPESISKLVDSIIQKQIDGEQLKNSPIKFFEVEVIKESFKNKIANIYHTRIEYPK